MAACILLAGTGEHRICTSPNVTVVDWSVMTG
jgi:hypothetical protein